MKQEGNSNKKIIRFFYQGIAGKSNFLNCKTVLFELENIKQINFIIERYTTEFYNFTNQLA